MKIKLIGLLLVVVMLLFPVSCKKVGNKVAGPVKPAETNVEQTKVPEAKEPEKPKEPVEPPKPEVPQPPPFEPIPTPPEIKNNTLAYLFREGDSLKKCKVSTQAISSVINIREVMQLTKYQDFEILCISTNRDYLMIEIDTFNIPVKDLAKYSWYEYKQTKNELYCLDIKNKTKNFVTELFYTKAENKAYNEFDSAEHFEASPNNQYFVFELKRDFIKSYDEGPTIWKENYVMLYNITSKKLEPIKKHKEYTKLFWLPALDLVFIYESTNKYMPKSTNIYEYNLQTKEEILIQDHVIEVNQFKNQILCLCEDVVDTYLSFRYVQYDAKTKEKMEKVIFQTNDYRGEYRSSFLAENNGFIIFIIQNSNDRVSALYLFNMEEQKLTLVCKKIIRGTYDSFSFSPDYSHLSFNAGDGRYVYDIENNKLIEIAKDKENISFYHSFKSYAYPSMVGWCVNSTRIYFNDRIIKDQDTNTARLFTYDLKTNKKELVYNNPSFSPRISINSFQLFDSYLYFVTRESKFILNVIYKGSLVYRVPLIFDDEPEYTDLYPIQLFYDQ